MTRDIKFRAWDRHGNRMVSWEEIFENKGYLYDFMNNVHDNLISLEFTGLKDKNGKEVYEGDVVKKFGKHIAEVKWGHCGIDLKIYDAYGYYLPQDNNEMLTLGEYVEVIGNIYENPELLK